MNTAITITVIICGTIVLLSAISAVSSIVAAKKTHDSIDKMFKEEK